MEKIISALHFPWQSMEDCMRTAAADLMLDGVELSWRDSFQRPHCTVEDLAMLPAAAAGRQLSLSAHIWDDIAELPGPQAVDKMRQWLELCRKSGVDNIVLHGGAYHDQKEGIKRVKRVLEQVLPEYEKADVILNLENHYAYDYRNCQELFSQTWEFLEVLTLDSPSLKFCFDTGHANMTDNTDQLLEQLAPWLNYVHLADNHGIDDDHVAYGQGTVQWEKMLALLRRVTANDFYLCVEFPVREDRQPFYHCMAEVKKHWS